MSQAIQQTIHFQGVGPEELYETYLDPARHGQVIGAPVTISGNPGSPFSAFGEGRVSGKTLHVLPHRVVVQTWRGTSWLESDPDSILVLTFSATPDGASVELVQILVPEHTRDLIHDGWHKLYWTPWQNLISEQRS